MSQGDMCKELRVVVKASTLSWNRKIIYLVSLAKFTAAPTSVLVSFGGINSKGQWVPFDVELSRHGV